jgi:hypothetical protein
MQPEVCFAASRQALEVPLANGKSYHFFICHHQGSGGKQACILDLRLRSLGYKVWYDNAQPSEERVLKGMQEGVSNSMCILIFLSGRKETDGEADKNGLYEGTFTR